MGSPLVNLLHSTMDSSASPVPSRAVSIHPLVHPFTCLLAVSLALTAVLHAVFYYFAERIWASGENVPIDSITTWTRWAMNARDGAEPQVLLLLVLALVSLAVLGMGLIQRLPIRSRQMVVSACLAVAALFAWRHPPRAPMAQIDPDLLHVVAVALVILVGAVAMRWAARQPGVHMMLALFLVPVCFLAISFPDYTDLSCILAPALKLRLGFLPSQIYFQYDYLMPMLAVGWHWLGGDPYAFSFVTQLSLYLFLLGCFLLARRLFQCPRLAGSLLVALCAVRAYANLEGLDRVPQVTPLRIDLWILLLTPTLLFGLRHWSVGMAAAVVFFFARSFGMLYLGSYALAIAADLLAQRATQQAGIPLWKEVTLRLRELAPPLLWIGAGLLASRLVGGGVVSDAVLMYRRLGIGMTRTSPDSFYWWIAPMLAATGWLAFSLWSRLSRKHAGAALFAVALGIGNSIYFFGRSNENNLLNISAVLLLCAFLGIDLAQLAWHGGPLWVNRTLKAAPWAVLAFIAFSYSGKLANNANIQTARVLRNLPPKHPEDPGVIACAEVAAVAKDRRVFVFSSFDYWVYERCGYVPPGYVQPLLLLPLRNKLIEQANQLLDTGYKIVVPKADKTQGSSDFDFADIRPALGETELTETPHYLLYSRKR